MATRMERRDFLKVLGVSGAGASLFGCSSQGPERLLPYVIPPEEITPGLATWYRTTCRECPAGCGMSVRTREGRAVKAEGNPLSPISHGKLCARGQASLHGLYDPDRIPQALLRDGGDWQKIGWDDAEQRLANALAQSRGRAVLLTGQQNGTMDRLLDEFAAAFQMRRVRYDALGLEPVRAAHRMLFGSDALPTHDFSRAEVVVSFGADFMETWISPVDYAHGFVQAHAYRQGSRGKLISVTPHQSLTDFSADVWLPARPGTEHLVALAMARAIADQGGTLPAAAAGAVQRVDVEAAARAAGVPSERILQAAREFANGGRSLAVGPGVQTSHGAATQLAIAVAILNAVAGNIGRTVHVGRAEAAGSVGTYADMQALLAQMRAGQVGALLVYGVNPLYSMPGADGVRDALDRVPFIASFSSYLDETSERAHLLLPDHHFLESWGDYVPRAGVHSLVQPVMVPVFDTKQTGDVLIATARRAGAALPTAGNTYYEYLRSAWARDVHPRAGAGAAFDDWWRESLQAGVVTTAEAAAPASAGAGAGAPAGFDLAGMPQFAGESDGYHLVVYPSLRFYDGRLANRAWLQELPDPVSKISWSSWVEVSPTTAEHLGLDNGSIAEVETPYGRATLPVWRHPGLRDDTIAIQLGQGHDALGRYAKDRGVNPMKLLGAVADPVSGGLVWIQTRAQLRATGDWDRIPLTGGRDTQVDRHVARELTLTQARSADVKAGALMTGGVAAAPAAGGHGAADAHAPTGAAPPATGPGSLQAAEHGEAPGGIEGLRDPNFHHWERPPMTERVEQLQVLGGFGPTNMSAAPQEYPPPGTHYGEYSEAHPRWGMAIDLERCIGCSACMTACYAENNIGVVGPRLVTEGRILSWIRIERYFDEGATNAGEHIDRGATFLPMLCQQCGNAPCEPVCPVYASYHTPDGLNGQVYNRCVGTRYCANNCPYKVRYFNYFTYEWPEPLNWQLNPDVTVREKGVMEKCTFCVQRIRDAQHHARLERRTVTDGEITPACAQTCPGDAIVFGNLKDTNSRVARIAASGRGYRVLDELNTQSAIVYLKKVLLREEAEEAAH